ncbi:hypothetical protein C8J57DRAFT_1255388 [Mycena rebaudengoi]|nr:hypothetical protein C8J57DRAFT_1255388 [Mycena rebaudengoi]
MLNLDSLSILFLLGAVNARFTFVDYLANITVGGQDFTVIVNTGSSVDYVDYPTGIQLQESQWDPSAAVDLCLWHGWLQHKHFNDLSAVSGRQGSPDFRERAALNGPVGFDTVAVGGLEVANQEIAVPNVATFNGHDIVSGLLLESVCAGTVKVPLLPQTAAALPQVAAASAATMLQCRKGTLAHAGCHRRLQNTLVEFNSASNGSQSMSFDNIIDNNVGNFNATNIYLETSGMRFRPFANQKALYNVPKNESTNHC